MLAHRRDDTQGDGDSRRLLSGDVHHRVTDQLHDASAGCRDRIAGGVLKLGEDRT